MNGDNIKYSYKYKFYALTTVGIDDGNIMTDDRDLM